MSIIPEKPKASQDKPVLGRFIKLLVDVPVTVQIIDELAVLKYQHWITSSDKKRVGIRCLGYNICPICMHNRSLGEDPKNHPDYIPVQKRYMINVVDLTPVKVSPSTGEIFMGTSITDQNGDLVIVYPKFDGKGNSLEEVPISRLKEVRVLERGPRLFEEKIDACPKLVHKTFKKRMKLQEFPIEITRVGEGRETTYEVVPLPDADFTVDVNIFKEAALDLNAGFAFTPEEIQAMLDGTPLQDIVAARQALEQTQEVQVESEVND